MPRFWSWDYLNHRPNEDEMFGPFSTAYLVVFLLLFFATVFLYNEGGRYLTEDPVRRKYLRKYAGFLLIPVTLALFFFSFRILQIDPFTFGRRIWLYLALLGTIGVLAYAAQDIRRHYQRDVAAQQRIQTRGRYAATSRRALRQPTSGGRARRGN
ncbi:MAG TPA: hypothetical protein VGT61_05015 [Thermomicrobiales bacterium]|jgi:hypothetical protein|nr:hypothetical protein [Thermomicrobiales bacterium]